MNDHKHLSSREFERLLEAVKASRNETRDRCLVLLMFRHGLRVSEACGSVLEQVDVESRVLHDARLKGSLSTTHPLRGDEIRAIKAWLVERSRMKAPGRAFFLSEQRKPLHRSPSTSPCANTARRPSYRWPFIPTCCAVPAALPSPIRVRTLA
jgi:type 1 fimbriae regulatory protein FimB